jgi:two-component system response regulator AlgR
MRLVITDDESLARTRLRGLVEEIGGIEIVAESANGRQALLQCDALHPDVVLLDIRMPGMDGLEAARHMAGLEPAPAVIFTTAYSEHALAAFDAHAIDYLLKPVRKARLQQALDKARRLTRSELDAVGWAAEGAPRPRTHISARCGGRIELVEVGDVAFFQAGDKYVSVHHSGGELLIDEPLKDLEEEFNQRFLRIHRGILAARELITGLEKDAQGHYHVLLKDRRRLPVSRRHVSELRALVRAGRAKA